MVDMFAHTDARAAFLAETEQQAGVAGVDDAEIALRKLLSNEPLAILYSEDGSYVKASTSILKTTSGADNSSASVQMCNMVQKSYKEHLAAARDGGVRVKHFGAAEVSEVGVQVGSLSPPSSLAWRVCIGFGAHPHGLRELAVHFQLEGVGGPSVCGFKCASLPL